MPAPVPSSPPLRSRRAWLPGVAVCLASLAAPAPTSAQFQDARLPRGGRLWFEVSPELLNWSEQFALASDVDSIADGDREPLSAHFDGPLPLRMHPAPVELLEAFNADADALGFDPVTLDNFSFGSLDFSTMRAQVRRLRLGGELGILDWLSVGFGAPFTLADMTTRFAFDSAAATVAGAAPDLEAGGDFSSGARGELDALDAMIDGGGLSGPDLAAAMELRARAASFLGALEDRAAAGGGLLPTGPSFAGRQVLARYAELEAAFEGLGLALPELALPEFSSMDDYEALFTETGFGDRLPRSGRNGFSLGEFEAFLRLRVFDGITRRRSAAPPATGVAPEGGGASEAGAASTGDGGRGVRFRTAVGGLMRFPIGSQNAPPFRDPSNSGDLPLGDGQTDIEVALYHDVAVGSALLVQSAVRYGMQRPDAYVTYAAPPDQPYGATELQALLWRDLGDYASVLVRPSLRLNPALSVGFEYDYFRLGESDYQIVDEESTIEDPLLAAIESGQTRHRVGVAFTLDLSESLGIEELRDGLPGLRRPWRFGISLRRAVSGSGGRTPASWRFGADLRAPIDVF